MPVRGHSWDYWQKKLMEEQGYDEETANKVIGSWEKESKETSLNTTDDQDDTKSLSTTSRGMQEESATEGFIQDMGLSKDSLRNYDKQSLVNIWKDANAYYQNPDNTWTDEDAEFYTELGDLLLQKQNESYADEEGDNKRKRIKDWYGNTGTQKEDGSVVDDKDLIKSLEESHANEEGLASVSGPADSSGFVGTGKEREEAFVLPDGKHVDDTQEALADTRVGGDLGKELGDSVVESHDPILLNENYLQFENILYRPVYAGENVTIEGNEALLIFENKYYTSEGVGNCPMCKGAGKVTVERLGLKECPKCNGSGDIQEQPQTPDIPQEQLQESKATESCGCKKKGMEANIKKYKSFIETEIGVLKKRAKAGEAVGIMYGLPTIRKNGRKIKGTLAYAGVSLNDRIYLPEELAKGHGKTLPLLLNHSSTAGAEEELDRLDDEMLDHLYNEKDYQVGEVTLTWVPEELTLYYEGVVDNEFFQKEIDDMNMAVSLGIYYDSDSPKVCDEECYTLIKGAEFREVSLVYHAGFPIATIEAVEAELKRKSKLSMAKEEMDQVLPDGSIDTSPLDDEPVVEEPVLEEAVAEEEEDPLPQGGSVDVEEKPTGEPLTVDVNEDKPVSVEAVYSPNTFSIRGVSGMTISNSNGVERYTFDPTQNYSTNTVHFSVIGEGATIFGEQLQPKMTTSDDVTKEIESKPDIEFQDSDEDILKKN